MSQPNPQTEQMLAAGADALARGDHASAVASFGAALAGSPDVTTQHYAPGTPAPYKLVFTFDDNTDATWTAS